MPLPCLNALGVAKGLCHWHLDGRLHLTGIDPCAILKMVEKLVLTSTSAGGQDACAGEFRAIQMLFGHAAHRSP